ncbi:uncharacterized protein LOC135930258 [Gordionus sp. m RMFG-2023]|uniref:uncharacterized protein LOC135930258 n=1 Tax=Gordionus sp. m RMFG-2023 TaxID=3053472 RepID=UPI0031FBDA7E
MSDSGISRCLKSMGWSRKRIGKEPDRRNSPDVINIRKEYCLNMMNVPFQNIFYLDETGFNSHVISHCRWAPLGKRPSVKLPSKGKKVSVLCTIGINGFKKYMVIDRAFTSIKFKTYLDELSYILPLNSLLIMDNAPIYRAHIITENYQNIVYLPPYSPQLNPIENFFAVLKNQYRSIYPKPNNRIHIIEAITSLLLNFTNFNFTAFYSHRYDI